MALQGLKTLILGLIGIILFPLVVLVGIILFGVVILKMFEEFTEKIFAVVKNFRSEY